MPLSFSAGVRDSLSNLAASLGVGRDKASHDAFGLRSLERAQIEAMYRGDWLARKTVDIVPYDSIRAWRAWSGHRADVDRMEAAERRLGLRKAIQRAMVLGRLYGGGAILIGTGETDPAALAQPLDERLPRGGLKFLHVVSRWQLGVAALDNDPLSQWVGEPALYELSAPGRAPLGLHPSRVVRFLGHPLPDRTLSPTFWSDSVLQVLYDAIHAVALTTAGATSLMHEAKVDIVTVPNLSEHLSSAETTQQLSARFAYAAAMKSINNLLLLGDGETWSRQSVDFGGLPEMVRTFLQVAAGAADIPVTRLLGQSPAGLSATGNLGEVKREGLAFTAELRSMAHRLNQTIGSTYSRSCEARLGDARCKVDLSQATLRSAFSASTGTAARVIAAAGLSGFASDWFTAGTLTFSTGANAAIPFEVKSHRRTSGIDQLELWLPPPFPIATGDTGTVVAGCRKTLAICKSKFDNVANFRGFPHIPGTDAVTRYGVQGALDTSGGSLFGSNG